MAESGSPGQISSREDQPDHQAGPQFPLAQCKPLLPNSPPSQTNPRARFSDSQSVYAEDQGDEYSEDWSDSSADGEPVAGQDGLSRPDGGRSTNRAQPTRHHSRYPRRENVVPILPREAPGSNQNPADHPGLYGTGGPPYSFQHPPHAPHVRQNSYPSAGYFGSHPPPPSRHNSNPFPTATSMTFPGPGPGPGPQHGLVPNYGPYGIHPRNMVSAPYSGDIYAVNQHPFPASYPSNQHGTTHPAGYYPPSANSYDSSYGPGPASRRSRSKGSRDARKLQEPLDSFRRDQSVTRPDPTEDQDRADRKMKEAADRQERRDRDKAHRRDLERLVKQQVKIEMRKRMQRQEEASETLSDSGKRKTDRESKLLLLENILRMMQGDDSLSQSSRGSRKESDTERLMFEIKELIDDRMGDMDGQRSTSDISARSSDLISRNGLELATREPRELVSRAEVQDIISDTLRNLKFDDGHEPRVTEERILNPATPSDQGIRRPLPPLVPQPPDSGRFISTSNGSPPPRTYHSGVPESRMSEPLSPTGPMPETTTPMYIGDLHQRRPRLGQERQRSLPSKGRVVNRSILPECSSPSSDGMPSVHPGARGSFSTNPPPRVPNPPVQVDIDPRPDQYANSTGEYGGGYGGERRRQAPPVRQSSQRIPRDTVDHGVGDQGRRRGQHQHRQDLPDESSDEEQYIFPPRLGPFARVPRGPSHPPPMAPDPPSAANQGEDTARDPWTRVHREMPRAEYYGDIHEDYEADFDSFRVAPPFVNQIPSRPRY